MVSRWVVRDGGWDKRVMVRWMGTIGGRASLCFFCLRGDLVVTRINPQALVARPRNFGSILARGERWLSILPITIKTRFDTASVRTRAKPAKKLRSLKIRVR